MNQPRKRVYIIAEAGVNHNGDKAFAFRLIDLAIEAGVDAIKFQTFKADKLVSQQVSKAAYQKANTDPSESQYDMLKTLELPETWHHELQDYATRGGIDFLSTAFDEGSLRFLETLDLPCYKVPSGELTNAPLVWQFGHTNKPLIISTGMATLSEVEEALAIVAHARGMKDEPKSIEAVRHYWATETMCNNLLENVTLLHCTSQYPTPWEEVNLRAMDTLAQAFGLPIGYSDHTEGHVIPIAAVARGATVIEKHVTLDRALPGPDHKASIEGPELKALVKSIRSLEKALGDADKVPQQSELETRTIARQSIIAAKHLPKGKLIERDDLTTARVGQGLAPALFWELIGSISTKEYEAGEAFER